MDAALKTLAVWFGVWLKSPPIMMGVEDKSCNLDERMDKTLILRSLVKGRYRAMSKT